MQKIATIILTFLLYSFTQAQTVTELYQNKNFPELVKLEKNATKLTPDELYMVGFAFFQLENDNKAIEFYNKAIQKGLDNGSVYFYKGLSLCYLKRYDEALIEIDIALKKEPTNQEFLSQKGQIYRYQGKEDIALEFFEEATKLPNTFGEPFFWVAYIYHGKQEFQKALNLYYVAAEKVAPQNSYYGTTFESIGQLEYTFTKDYAKSAKAYAQAIAIDPDNYELHYKLMKSLNAAKEYVKAENAFLVVKKAFEEGKLPQTDMEIKTVPVAEFQWNGQTASITRSLIDPKETLDISYKVFLLTKEGDKVERRFVVEKTVQVEKNGAKHLLCEQDKKTGGHITYPYGWSTDKIQLDDLEDVVKLILDGKMKYAAKSAPNKK
ncbi:tetratricopeptide repeat protein [Flavobacterium ardleyense]|uniref:Tetratricopeptide repeat protein n=1 Tax=Flavobacterium ardleyense TaxID=2038737 RepID=A0ABW5Z6D0_9FLAO